jgi:gamma-glutamyltranspeptidase/glutathione hydrolase
MFTTRPEIIGTFGVVASTHWLASQVGMSMLERGGNAFDAAVATAFTLQVVEPHLNGPGGEAPILLHAAKEQKVRVLCGQGVSPQAATIEHMRGLGLDIMPGTGLLPACVPGSFDAWMTLLRDYGTMKPSDVLAPAIYYAGNGYPLVQRIPDAIAAVAEMFRKEWPTSAAVYLPGGAPPKAFTLFKNPGIAETYGRIAREADGVKGSREKQIDHARRLWSQGFVAEAIADFCARNEVMDSSGRRHRGLLTGDDLARWHASYEEPATVDYRNYTMCKCGPWSQGPSMLEALALLRGLDLPKMDTTGPDFVHVVTEAFKLAFADREAFYADPDFADVPMDKLLSGPYADERRKLIGKDASLEFRPGRIPGFGGPILVGQEGGAAGAGEPTVGRLTGPTQVHTGHGAGEELARRVHAAGAGEPTVQRNGLTQGDTVHIDVIDRDGNMVSATPSGGWLQSSPVIPPLGFCLGTRGQMFWLDPASPTHLQPGKRPRTTLTPSLALKDGKAWLSFGTPGGDQQEQWSLTTFLRHVDHGLNLQAAIDAPNFHGEHMTSSFWPRAARPGVLAVEDRLPAATIAELERRGHIVEKRGDWALGRVSAASREDGMLKAGANPRGMQGYAVGR